LHCFSKENQRSRLDSASSDISQFSVGASGNSSSTYVSPARTHVPPSDIESEYGGDESDHESSTVGHMHTYRTLSTLLHVRSKKMLKMSKLLAVYKNKFSQLKNAYDEVEREKDHIKVKTVRLPIMFDEVLFDCLFLFLR
jgi:hypothetical protein